jgi:elongation factor Ts
MAEITAKLVNELRAKTGQGMMECKKMLTEVGGDIEKAIAEFRKKGVKASLAERAATEGRVFGAVGADAKTAAIIEINCNTDFTAKSEPIKAAGEKAARQLGDNPNSDPNAAVAADLTNASQTTGENVRLGKTATLSAPAGGKVGLYIYGISGKIGVLMAFTGNPSDETITDVGGHIAFSRPLALNRDGIDPALVAKERDFAVAQAKETGKPQNIAEKIAEGKMQAFYKERALLDQDFFNAQKFKGSIEQLLKSRGCTLTKYARIEVGQA